MFESLKLKLSLTVKIVRAIWRKENWETDGLCVLFQHIAANDPVGIWVYGDGVGLRREAERLRKGDTALMAQWLKTLLADNPDMEDGIRAAVKDDALLRKCCEAFARGDAKCRNWRRAVNVAMGWDEDDKYHGIALYGDRLFNVFKNL